MIKECLNKDLLVAFAFIPHSKSKYAPDPKWIYYDVTDDMRAFARERVKAKDGRAFSRRTVSDASWANRFYNGVLGEVVFKHDLRQHNVSVLHDPFHDRGDDPDDDYIVGHFGSFQFDIKTRTGRTSPRLTYDRVFPAHELKVPNFVVMYYHSTLERMYVIGMITAELIKDSPLLAPGADMGRGYKSRHGGYRVPYGAFYPLPWHKGTSIKEVFPLV